MKRTYLMGLAALSFVVLAACQSAPAATETAAATPAAPVAAADEAATLAAAGTTEAAAADTDIVCRSMKVTGTRFAKRECKTVTAWNEYDTYTNQNAKEATEKFQRLNTGGSVSTN